MKPNRVALIISDYPSYELFCPNFSGMKDGLDTLGIEYKVFSCRPSLDISAVIDYFPDFVLYGLLDLVKHQSWRNQIRNALPEAKIAFWYGDYRDDMTGQISADLSEIDMMFVSNDGQNEYYKGKWKVKDCRFLPLGASIKNVPYDKNYDFGFVFIGAKITGSVFSARVAEVSQFEKEGLRVLNAHADRYPELRAKILKMMPTIYRSSSVSLDVSHFTHIPSYTSNRFWNIPASGGVALTKRFPGCEALYPEGTRVYFDTIEEGIAIKNKLLANPDKIAEIRKNAIKHAENHTYDKRFLEMFRQVYYT